MITGSTCRDSSAKKYSNTGSIQILYITHTCTPLQLHNFGSIKAVLCDMCVCVYVSVCMRACDVGMPHLYTTLV